MKVAGHWVNIEPDVQAYERKARGATIATAADGRLGLRKWRRPLALGAVEADAAEGFAAGAA